MNYFLDIGTNYFQGFNRFFYSYTMDENWCVYCYEPVVEIYNNSKDLAENYRSKLYDLHHLNVAVYDSNCVKPFRVCKTIRDRSTGLLLKKHDPSFASNFLDIDIFTGNIAHIQVYDTKEVVCVDILEILEGIVSQDQSANIFMKIDIEGAEYPVINRILEFERLKHIRVMHVEWHSRFWKKHPDYKSIVSMEDDLIGRTAESGILLVDHE